MRWVARRTRHPGQLSLSHPSVSNRDEYPAKAGKVNSRDTLTHIRGLVVVAGVWRRDSFWRSVLKYGTLAVLVKTVPSVNDSI